MSAYIWLLVSAGLFFCLVAAFLLWWYRCKRLSSQKAAAEAEQQIYIGNVPYSTSEAELQKYFSRYGRIKRLHLVQDRRTGRSKGYAFVTFIKLSDAKQSLSAHGQQLGGRSLVVRVARSRPKKE